MSDAELQRANTLPFGNVDKAIMQDPAVAPMAKLIYAYLTTYAAGVRQAFPSKATIAQHLGVDRRTVDRAMEKLAEAGVVEVRRRRTDRGDWGSNLYVIYDFGPRYVGTGADGGTGKNVPTPPGADVGTLPAQMSHEEDKGTTPGGEHQEEISPAGLFEVDAASAADAKTSTFDGVTFDQFWEVYPRRAAKKAAQRAWLTALNSVKPPERGVLAKTIVDGARRYAVERNGEPDKFTRYPATWLNGGCWDDEPGKKGGGNPRGGYQPYHDDDYYGGGET